MNDEPCLSTIFEIQDACCWNCMVQQEIYTTFCNQLHPLKIGEMIAREDDKVIVVLKWKDVHNIRMLSIKLDFY